MTQAFQVDRLRIAHFLSCIERHEPINNERKWSGFDLLLLAGCIHAQLVRMGPWRKDLDELHTEQRQAVEDDLPHELAAAIRYLSSVALNLVQGDFVANYGDVLCFEGLLNVDASGAITVRRAEA